MGAGAGALSATSGQPPGPQSPAAAAAAGPSPRRVKRARQKQSGSALAFGTAEIFHFEPAVSAVAVPNHGPPLGLKKRHFRASKVPIDRFEAFRRQTQPRVEKHEFMRKGWLDPEAREQRLEQHGVQREDWAELRAECELLLQERRHTVMLRRAGLLDMRPECDSDDSEGEGEAAPVPVPPKGAPPRRRAPRRVR